MTKELAPLTEQEVEERIEKILLELQLVLCANTKDGNKENTYIMLTAAISLYTMVSKKFVKGRDNHLYNSGIAWDNMKLEDLTEITYQ